MSKIAILKSLPTPSELRQSVQELQSLEQLPDLVAEQVTQSLEPLLTLRQEVLKALEAFDRVSQVQRETLGALAQELGTQATASMERRTEALDESIRTLASQVKGLKSSTVNAEASCKKLLALPSELTETVKNSSRLMQAEAKALMAATYAARPRVMLTLGLLLAASVLGALLVGAGQVALNKILPPDVTQRNAAWAANVWANATPAERQLLTQIVSRPAK